MATVEDSKERVVEALKFGIRDYIVKPLSSKIFEGKVKSLPKIYFLYKRIDIFLCRIEELVLYQAYVVTWLALSVLSVVHPTGLCIAVILTCNASSTLWLHPALQKIMCQGHDLY
jgi:hypothetical protein